MPGPETFIFAAEEEKQLSYAEAEQALDKVTAHTVAKQEEAGKRVVGFKAKNGSLLSWAAVTGVSLASLLAGCAKTPERQALIKETTVSQGVREE